MRTASRSRFAVVGMAMAALLLTLGLPFPQSAAAATFGVNVTTGPNAFTPQNLGNITAGDTIVWTNVSGTHDVTSASIPVGATAWVSPTLTGSATFSMAFTVAGNYRYFCSIHSDAASANLATQPTTSQVGQFTVVAAAATPTPTPTPTPSPSASANPSPSPSANPSPSPSANPSPSPSASLSAAPSPSAAPTPSGNSGGTAPVSSARPTPPATNTLLDLPGGMPGFAVLALAVAVIGSVVIALAIASVRGVARQRPGR